MLSLKSKLKKKEDTMKSQKSEAEQEIDRQWLRIRHLEQNNKNLLKNLLDLCEQEEIQTFEGGKYIVPLREVVLNLVKMNIGHRNIVPAIKVVIEKLTSHTIGKLPSYGTINKMVHEAKCLALLQAGKAMLTDKEGKRPANALMENATSKRRRTQKLHMFWQN